MTDTTSKKTTLQKKIFVFCMLISLVPICILGIFCVIYTKDALISREEIALTDTLKQENTVLDSKLNSYEDAVNYICWNEQLKQAMCSSYDSNYEMYLLYRDTVQPLLWNVKSLYSDVTEVVLYTDMEVFPKPGTLQPIHMIESFSWYEQANENYNVFAVASPEERKLSFICRIYGTGRNTVIVKMDIDYDSFFSSFSTLYEKYYSLKITDKNKEVIYQFMTDDMQEYVEGSEKEQVSGNKLLEKKIINSYMDWEITIARPTDVVYAPVSSFATFFFLILLTCLICVFILSLYMSRSIVRPLKKLQKSIQKVESGNYSVVVDVDSNDEIGQLADDFNHMTKQIEYMINEVLTVKLQQKEQELLALQSQINPHFFYNSLSLINSKAILCNQKEIAQMVQYLSTFYRTSLSKGKSVISLKEELENVRAYIDIQLLMHSNSFRVEYEIDERIYPYMTQKLILQPLVENAILHGLDHIRKEEKLLSVSGRLSEDIIVFQIADNGVGIALSDLETLLTKDTKGYGIKNVHKRIQMRYGPQYGLSYQSVPNEGTVVTLVFPKTLE